MAGAEKQPWTQTWLPLAVGIPLGLVLFNYCFGGTEGTNADVGKAVEAFTVCQQFEDELKAPSTAEYPAGYSDYTRSLGGGRFHVDAYVDSENSFGAMIRTDFSCTVSYQGNETWQLENLAFD